MSTTRDLTKINLLSPLTIRSVTLRNRIVVSPMCQYSSVDGMADDWHLVHLGSRAAGGAALVFTEATAVTPEGRISPSDLGIWEDRHIEPLKRAAAFIHRMGAIAGIQLAHSGRKGSTQEPWKGRDAVPESNGGWPIVGPSAIPFSSRHATPHELNEAEIAAITKAFVAAAKRALVAGFKIIEIHSAHGYLLHEFLSPISNKRTDRYGGSFENRIRLVSEVVTAIRKNIPDNMPLFIRISSTDWVEGGWDIAQSVELARVLKPLGVDLVDCSSGAMVPDAKMPIGPGYQVPFAEEIRRKTNILTGAVGLITEPKQADEIIASGKADLVFLAREMLREPYWAIKAQETLGGKPDWPIQYGYAVRR